MPVGTDGLVAPYHPSLTNQTPVLALNWVTPDVIMIGQEADFELVLRNHGRVAMRNILIEQVLPEGFEMIAAVPEPTDKSRINPFWRVDVLEPQQENRIKLRLKPQVAGDATSNAKVTFSTEASANFRVVEPKLEIDVQGSEGVIVGDQAILVVVVKNPGTGPATNTVLTSKFPKGLSMLGDNKEIKIGTLKPKESRSLRILANVNELGKHNVDFIATADHNLRDQEDHDVTGLGARLLTDIKGPTFRYLTRPAEYQLKLKNEGTATAENVHIRLAIPEIYTFVKAADGGRFDSSSRTVHWPNGNLEAGREISTKVTLLASNRGKGDLKTETTASRGIRVDDQLTARVEGIAAILLEVVDAADPVEVGANTFYEVLVTNQGTDFADEVQVKVELPESLEVVDVKGPTGVKQREGNMVVFHSINRLAPRADAVYRVYVTGNAPGDMRIKVQANSKALSKPVVEEESTRWYNDRIE